MGCSLKREVIDQTIAFHGHRCPGLMIGIRASELALKRLGNVEGKDLMAVVETDMCGVDAIQFLTGCTFGKGNLIHKDYGKMAFTFYDRGKGTGFRILFCPEASADSGPELQELMKKTEAGSISEEEQARIQILREKLQAQYMDLGLEEMFIVTEVTSSAPKPARILQSLRCEACGEMAMESRTRRFAGKTLCLPCFEKMEQKV